MERLKDRERWVAWMSRIAEPALGAMAQRRLKEAMPVQQGGDGREAYTHLEALGRLLSGLAPWLELEGLEGEEEALRRRYADWARAAIDSATDPASPDAMNFSDGYQPIVDAAFLAHALIRAPRELAAKLPDRVRSNLIAALQQTRSRKPVFSNWLLFAAMTETALYTLGADWDRMRVDYALKQHEQWYKGDGMYGDGPNYHADYYNSFVIQPMLVDILRTVGSTHQEWETQTAPVFERASRYAGVLERMISPEGAFPVFGRSLAYRFGAFQMLAQAALQEMLPEGVMPAQVRCALTAVIGRMIEAPGTFDEAGWLRIGFCGDQPGVAEPYISTGSLYLCAAVFLPLGLAPDHPFWQGQEDWTSVKAFGGRPFPIDHAIKH
jgi:hypothetical protein